MATGKPHLDAVRRRIELVTAELPPDVGPRFGAMFGGVGVSGRERMSASLLAVGPPPRPAPPDRATLLAVEGARPLQYEVGGPPSKQYVVVPTRIGANPIDLGGWVRRNIEHAASAPATKQTGPSGQETS